MYHILSSIMCTFYIENDAEIFPAHMEGRKGFKMVYMMNKLAILILVKIFLKNEINFFLPKINVKFSCALYL